MAYCAKADIVGEISEEILIQLTDDAGTGTVDDAVVTQKIADADSEIDSYCGGRYTVPMSPVPARVHQLSVDIAVYNLYARRAGTLPDERKTRYQDAIRFLRDVSTGKASILGVDAPAETSDSGPQVSSQERIFTRDKLSGF
jgi:phage gp36-like protein